MKDPNVARVGKSKPQLVSDREIEIVYVGDITAKLTAFGTLCPFHLDADGNTVQTVPITRGLGAFAMQTAEWESMAMEAVLDDVRVKNGRVLRYRWKS